ncbi:MAG: hypothetical protein PGN34_09055 [Methylobacterium frigidaeris]
MHDSLKHPFDRARDRLDRMDRMLAEGEVRVAEQRLRTAHVSAYGWDVDLAARVLDHMERLLEQQKRLRETIVASIRELEDSRRLNV